MEPTWEPVAEGLDRIAVPGGWLYRTTTLIGVAGAVAIAFVPTPAV